MNGNRKKKKKKKKRKSRTNAGARLLPLNTIPTAEGAIVSGPVRRRFRQKSRAMRPWPRRRRRSWRAAVAAADKKDGSPLLLPTTTTKTTAAAAAATVTTTTTTIRLSFPRVLRGTGGDVAEARRWALRALATRAAWVACW